MIITEYNHQTNKFHHISQYDEQKRIDFIAIDINTNLPCAAWWVILPPLGYSEFNLPTNYLPHLSGIEVNTYCEGELISTSTHQWKKPDNRFQFSAPKEELSYGSWHSLVYNDEYESKFNEDDVIYDLGANFGVYTMLAVNNNVEQIYAFEPTPKNVTYLKQTFQFDDNVIIFDKAIGGEDKKVTFYLQEHSVGNSMYSKGGTPLEVDCINLETFILNNNLKPPTIIKCDIEGSEYDFIESLTDGFFEGIHTFIVEFHNNNNNQIWNPLKRLLNLGYNIKMNNNDKIDADMSTFVARK